MADVIDIDALTETARELLKHERLRDKDPDPPPPEDAKNLLSKALDVIASLTGGQTRKDRRNPGRAGDRADKALDGDRQGGTTTLDRGMSEDDDKDDDQDLYAEIMSLLQASQSHLDKHGDGDDEWDSDSLVKALQGHSAPGAVTINGYLVKALEHQQAMTTRVKTLESVLESVVKALALVGGEVRSSRTHATAQAVVSQALLKGMATLLDGPHMGLDDSADRTQPSRHASFEKASLARLGPEGGQAIPYDKSRAASMRLSGKISKEDAATWKQTNRLPDHVQFA